MTDQPDQPPRPPSGQPPNQPSGQPTTGSTPTPPGPPRPNGPPTPNAWSQATSTSGGRWALGLAAAAIAVLMLLGVGLAGLLVLRAHDRFDAGRGRDGLNSRQGDRDDRGGRGDDGLGERQPLRPGAPGRDGGQGGLGSLLGGTALHGTVTLTVNGALQTLVFQRGEVTAVSVTSITLKSADGFTGTYRRTAETTSLRSEPIRGGQALVLARSADKVAITVRAA